MPKATDFPAVGKVLSRDDTSVVFNPQNTNYELKLEIGKYDGPIGQRVQGFIILSARKVYTVPSGGNFVSPIFGPPKIVQGRVRLIDGAYVVVHAGANFIVELPARHSFEPDHTGDRRRKCGSVQDERLHTTMRCVDRETLH